MASVVWTRWRKGRSSCAAAAYLARPVTVVDIETDPLWEYRREAALHAGLRAAWAAPIVASDGQVVGTIAVYRRQPGRPKAGDQELLALDKPEGQTGRGGEQTATLEKGAP